MISKELKEAKIAFINQYGDLLTTDGKTGLNGIGIGVGEFNNSEIGLIVLSLDQSTLDLIPDTYNGFIVYKLVTGSIIAY
jgi:hypothetical protein